MPDKKYSYKNPVCRGSYALGTACGHCERCSEQFKKMYIGDSSKYKNKTKADRLCYLMDSNKSSFKGVASSDTSVKFCMDVDGKVTVFEGQISISDFNDMCIAWLCLYNPSAVSRDKSGGDE